MKTLTLDSNLKKIKRHLNFFFKKMNFSQKSAALASTLTLKVIIDGSAIEAFKLKK